MRVATEAANWLWSTHERNANRFVIVLSITCAKNGSCILQDSGMDIRAPPALLEVVFHEPSGTAFPKSFCDGGLEWSYGRGGPHYRDIRRLLAVSVTQAGSRHS